MPATAAFQDEAASEVETFRIPENVASIAVEIEQETTSENVASIAKKSGGSGLPSVTGIQWEKCTDRPGVKAWYSPQGSSAPRHTKTYLGYVGKKLSAAWLAMSVTERRAAIEPWLAEAKQKKGINETND